MDRINKKWLALLPAAFIALGSVACGGGDEADGGDAPAPAATTAAADGGGGGVTGEAETEIVVLAKDNFFEPDQLEIPVGQAVTITLKNEGAAIHNMHVLSSETEGEDYRSDPLVNPGSESSFDVQFSQAGTYKFQCDLHMPGMVGEITVS